MEETMSGGNINGETNGGEGDNRSRENENQGTAGEVGNNRNTNGNDRNTNGNDRNTNGNEIDGEQNANNNDAFDSIMEQIYEERLYYCMESECSEDWQTILSYNILRNLVLLTLKSSSKKFNRKLNKNCNHVVRKLNGNISKCKDKVNMFEQSKKELKHLSLYKNNLTKEVNKMRKEIKEKEKLLIKKDSQLQSIEERLSTRQREHLELLNEIKAESSSVIGMLVTVTAAQTLLQPDNYFN